MVRKIKKRSTQSLALHQEQGLTIAIGLVGLVAVVIAVLATGSTVMSAVLGPTLQQDLTINDVMVGNATEVAPSWGLLKFDKNTGDRTLESAALPLFNISNAQIQRRLNYWATTGGSGAYCSPVFRVWHTNQDATGPIASRLVQNDMTSGSCPLPSGAGSPLERAQQAAEDYLASSPGVAEVFVFASGFPAVVISDEKFFVDPIGWANSAPVDTALAIPGPVW